MEEKDVRMEREKGRVDEARGGEVEKLRTKMRHAIQDNDQRTAIPQNKTSPPGVSQSFYWGGVGALKWPCCWFLNNEFKGAECLWWL